MHYNSKLFITHLNFSIVFTLFLGLLIFSSATPAISQEVPCFNSRKGQIEFVKVKRKSLENICRNRKVNPAKNQNNIGEITISGHITHQNGVRMSGVTLRLREYNSQTETSVVTDEEGNYLLGNLTFGGRYELTPLLEGYEFYPPQVIWEGIVESEIQNFIAVGPPPIEPPDPPGTPVLAWTSYTNGQANQSEYNPIIARDAQGNVYLGGTSYTDADSGNTDIIITKNDSNGNLLWSRTFNGTADYKDGLRDMAVDAAGNVYLTGYSYSLPASGNLRSYDFITQKYDANGNLVWSKNYGPNEGYDDSARSLKMDSSGNIIVSGYSWGVGTFANYATVKYDTNGNLLWARRFVGGNGELPTEVETDSAGNVYVTGYSNHSAAGGSEDIVTIKYSPTGEQLWLNRYNSPADDTDEGYEIEIDGAGNVFVVGVRYVDFNGVMIIQKINGASGATIWVNDFSVTGSFDGETYPTAMEIDANNNIIVAGMTNMTGEFYNVDTFVAKFDAQGVLLWERTYDGPADEDYDGDTKMVMDEEGNIYLGATSEGFANPDIQIIKYTSTGDVVWRYRFGNPYLEYDYLMDWGADISQTAMLLDEAGNVFVAGESYVPEQGTNLVAFKLEPVAELRAVPFDFDGDKKADLAVFRPETGVWYVLKSSDGTTSRVKWGLPNDKLVPADYDGDGKTDYAIFRDGVWYVQKSSGGNLITQFGLANDLPVPSDFDNDGRADLGVFRQGIWHQLHSSDNSYKAFQFGISSDKPIPSDYDKNRRSDVAVFRNGNWFVSYQAELPFTAFQFGISTDKPVPADYDGDRQTDYAVFRNGVWYIRLSRTNTYSVIQWGIGTDIPVPADYDGDRRADLAVYRNGTWYILRSFNNTYSIVQFGLATDIPVPSAYSR